MIDTFEEHSEVAATWVRPGQSYHRRRVVCFDRHLDLKPISPQNAERLRGITMQRGGFEHAVRPLPIRYAPGAFGLDDFWAAAAVAGVVDHLVWVMPGVETVGWRERAVRTLSMLPMGPAPDQLVLSPHHLQARCYGLRLDIVPFTELDRYWSTEGWPDPTVDVDLDWFVADDGRMQHQVEELAQAIRRFGGHVTSMTWSQRSGFTSAAHRPLADELSAVLGQSRRDSTFLPSVASLEHLLGVRWTEGTTGARSDEPDSLDPGIHHAVVGQQLVSTDRGAATEHYWRSAEHGIRANALAYGIALSAMADGAWGEAENWATRSAEDDPYDTVASHAQVVRVLTLVRSGRREEALDACLRVMDELPLRRSVVDLATHLGRSMGARAAMEAAASSDLQLAALRQWSM